MPRVTDNGAKKWTLNSLVDRFYTSRFNRDNLHDPAEGEDIDNSRLYRLYNKSDVKELMHIFFEYFEWVVSEENLCKVYLTKNMSFIRETRLPTVKRANIVDEIRSPNRAKAGELYVTRGKYLWTIYFSGEPHEKQRELQFSDPEFIAKYEELQKKVDERKKIENEQKSEN